MISKSFQIAMSTSLGLLIALTLVPGTIHAQSQKSSVKNIVLVHGAWADGSSWSKLIPLLIKRGFNVVAVQNPLSSLQDDATATTQAVERIVKSNPGPVLLVGHSYGGTIITEAGSNPDVAGLVYVAAFAPDEGETTLGLAGAYPTPAAPQFLPDDFGFLTLSHEGIFDDFAQDLSPREKELLFITQGPTAAAALLTPVDAPAWKVKPTWFVVAANDRTISPDLELMEAKRMGATTITIPASHVAMLALPNIVADFITLAAQTAAQK